MKKPVTILLMCTILLGTASASDTASGSGNREVYRASATIVPRDRICHEMRGCEHFEVMPVQMLNDLASRNNPWEAAGLQTFYVEATGRLTIHWNSSSDTEQITGYVPCATPCPEMYRGVPRRNTVILWKSDRPDTAFKAALKVFVRKLAEFSPDSICLSPKGCGARVWYGDPTVSAKDRFSIKVRAERFSSPGELTYIQQLARSLYSIPEDARRRIVWEELSGAVVATTYVYIYSVTCDPSEAKCKALKDDFQQNIASRMEQMRDEQIKGTSESIADRMIRESK
jgi:hypothetical protein